MKLNSGYKKKKFIGLVASTQENHYRPSYFLRKKKKEIAAYLPLLSILGEQLATNYLHRAVNTCVPGRHRRGAALEPSQPL